MRKMLMIIAVLSLIAGVAIAKQPSKTAPKGGVYDYALADKGFTEGFEGAFPPAGWTAGITNPANTWYQDSLSFFEGAYAARIGWQAGVPQDETLNFSATVAVGDDLSFHNMGSTYWCSNGNFTCEINGTEVYNFCLENSGTSWVWEEVVIDLAAYEGTTIAVSFRYAGDDGADHHLDFVVLGENTPPPPPPPVSFCDLLEDASGCGNFSGDTCDGQNLVEALGCEAYSEAGLEDYFEIEMPAGSSFTATVTNTADGALWVVGECEAEGGAFTCLGYADDTLGGDPEVVSYTNASGLTETVYLVVDSWGTDSCGTYDMVMDCTGGAIANEDLSFGQIKDLFR